MVKKAKFESAQGYHEKVEAIIQPFKLEEVKEALKAIGVCRCRTR